MGRGSTSDRCRRWRHVVATVSMMEETDCTVVNCRVRTDCVVHSTTQVIMPAAIVNIFALSLSGWAYSL